MEFFRRIEQKYVLSKKEYEKLNKEIQKYVNKDPYYYSNILSVYFDTKDDRLIINSMESPLYKEKFRLRSYGPCKDNDKVFLEIKKKYNSITSKRRTTMTLKEFWDYYNSGKVPSKYMNNTMKEIDYDFKKYNLIPKMFISYERYSYYDKNNKNIRITFDFNARFRTFNLNLDSNSDTKQIIKDDIYIMEVKSLDKIPMWLVKIFSKLKIYPKSFSKYKEAYLKKEV